MRRCAVLKVLIVMAERKDGQVLYAATAGVESVDVAIDRMLDYQH
jgi:hypothetical protein